jgi:hypothetical protein
MDHYAYSSAGELDSKFLAPCVAIVFTDNTVMIEHRSDPLLYHKRENDKRIDEVDAMHLFENIVKNIGKGRRRIRPQISPPTFSRRNDLNDAIFNVI